ncbi:leucine-rich repeat extensin-like protein 5 [Helianthus annuus]|uniref:leucine-rich repeat extensin-like protein 5 n=1 Tax=Helianthus annuus TaxID=4232 RepID=UPI000B8F3414|nr:leucine-rich repeat extensin-like protein 5 [Helianthus annuus]
MDLAVVPIEQPSIEGFRVVAGAVPHSVVVKKRRQQPCRAVELKFTIMPPRVRGRGKGPMRGGPSSARLSHRRTPSASFSTSDSHDMWGQPFEPARHPVSLSSSPSFHPSFGPFAPVEPEHSHHSHQSHHSHESHHFLQSHSFHHSDSLYSPGQFNPAEYVNDFLGYNPLGPEDHFSQEMEMDDDPDPEMQTGTPGHPISISSGSPFQGSPYRGPDSFRSSTSSCLTTTTPGRGATAAATAATSRASEAKEERPHVRNRRTPFQFSSWVEFLSPIPEDPQMGGPSNAAPEANPPQASYAPPLPPVGFDNPIPTYPGPSGYNPYENPTGYPSDYVSQDPYLTAAQYHHLYPSTYPSMHPTGYPMQGYQYPPYQPPPPQQLQQQQQTQEILERLDKVEHKTKKNKERYTSFMKGLANLIKGKKK